MEAIKKEDIQAAVGIFLAVGTVSAVSSTMEYNFLLAPFGATCVIVFLTHGSEFAAPRNVIGGYTVTSIVGVAVAFLLGHGWWTYALGVGAAMLVKRALRVVHPPSAAMPIILLSLEEGKLMEFVLDSVLPGLLVLLAVAVLYNRYFLKNGYPLWR